MQIEPKQFGVVMNFWVSSIFPNNQFLLVALCTPVHSFQSDYHRFSFNNPK